MIKFPMSRLTALSASASLVLVLALAVPAPALARNDTLKKLLLLGAAALVVKTVIDNQNRSNTRSAPIYTTPGLSYAEVTDLQWDLRRAGFYSGRIDGIWGGQTKQAVLDWQRAYGYQPTGVLTQAQLDRLGRSFDGGAGGSYTNSVRPISTTTIPDRFYYGTTNLTRSQLTTLQTNLQFLGYYSGPVDGVWGVRSQAALELYRQDQDDQANFNLRSQPGSLDLASVAISARELEDEIAADLDERLSRSNY